MVDCRRLEPFPIGWADRIERDRLQRSGLEPVRPVRAVSIRTGQALDFALRRAAALLRAAVPAAALLAAAPAAAQNVGGTYTVKGTNFDGSSYKGTATITLTSNTTCRIVWQTGGSSSAGICMRNHEAFSAAYQLGNRIGLVIYAIRPDGSLEGVWTIADQSGAGTETLTPQ